MAGDQDPLTVVRLLAENEELISDLYTAYAKRFPEHADFWSGLAVEERDHARWLRELGSRVEEGSLYVNEDRFRREPIRLFHEYLEGELRRQAPMPLARALSVALSTEQALIERRFFEVFETDSAELKHILRDLASATEEHVKQVRDMWAKHKE
jgi:rubrerythrin